MQCCSLLRLSFTVNHHHLLSFIVVDYCLVLCFTRAHSGFVLSSIDYHFLYYCSLLFVYFYYCRLLLLLCIIACYCSCLFITVYQCVAFIIIGYYCLLWYYCVILSVIVYYDSYCYALLIIVDYSLLCFIRVYLFINCY